METQEQHHQRANSSRSSSILYVDEPGENINGPTGAIGLWS